MDGIDRHMAIAKTKIGILPAKRLFCLLLILFKTDGKPVAENLEVYWLAVKKCRELADAENI
ncbi:MAG: hypothetical protein LBO04_02290 [Spirochaetaceae bacterium]|jgi:hypothetical protein|nr:hypothetical protein [Spirochaetaceae bacterium]